MVPTGRVGEPAVCRQKAWATWERLHQGHQTGRARRRVGTLQARGNTVGKPTGTDGVTHVWETAVPFSQARAYSLM